MLNKEVSVKFGQIAVDTEFMLSEGAAWFLSATYGWPPITAANLQTAAPPIRSPNRPSGLQSIRMIGSA